jgi:hypothetical protein
MTNMMVSKATHYHISMALMILCLSVLPATSSMAQSVDQSQKLGKDSISIPTPSVHVFQMDSVVDRRGNPHVLFITQNRTLNDVLTITSTLTYVSPQGEKNEETTIATVSPSGPGPCEGAEMKDPHIAIDTKGAVEIRYKLLYPGWVTDDSGTNCSEDGGGGAIIIKSISKQ